MRRLFRLILATVILAVTMTGCKSSRQAGLSAPAGTVPAEASENFKTIISSYADWSELSVPLTIELKKPTSFRISGTLTMRRDNYIHFSARMLGMEVASVMITTDSVFAKEKLHKMYVAESLAPLISKVPLTVGNIQQLILGHVFLPGRENVLPLPADAEIYVDGERWAVGATILEGGYAFGGAQPGNPVNFTAVPDLSTNIQFVSSDFVTTQAGPAAKSVQLSATVGDRITIADLSTNFSKARWSGVADKSWETPRGYRRISSADLLKMLSAL